MKEEIQTAINEVGELKGVVQSVNAGMTILTQQNADQAKQIADLIAQGAGSVTADDLAALKQSNSDLADSITALKTNIPASTSVPQAPAAPVTV